MTDTFLFADEAGCFSFNRQPNVSRYFILCSVTMASCELASDLIHLRHDLAWRDEPLGDYFHATTDQQSVRDAVFEAILQRPFHVHATIMEKSKAQQHIRAERPTFYKFGWYFHFKHGPGKSLLPTQTALVTAAALGTKKERIAFEAAVDDVMRQTNVAKKWATDFLPAAAHPCLQVADYCAWAIQRKWERGDTRSYDLIMDRIQYEYDLWERGDTHYY
jgi:hypothetical protein